MRGTKSFVSNSFDQLSASINQWIDGSYDEFKEKGGKFELLDVKFQCIPEYMTERGPIAPSYYAMALYEISLELYETS